MEPSEPLNPYAPPSAAIDVVAHAPADDGSLPADRGTRLGAALLDGLINLTPFFIGSIIGLAMLVSARVAAGVPGEQVRIPPEEVFRMMVPMLWGMGIGGLGSLGIGIFQWYRITVSGQSIAKRLLKIKIVNLDGTPVTFGSGVALRSILPGFIVGVPYLGFIFWLVDVLFIFRDDRRCLHDLMAGTKVIALPQD